MAEEQIDKLTIEVESVGGDDKSIADIRKQLEKLGRVDLSGTIRQLGNLRTALGYLGTVDDSVKSMLDNMTKLGLRASSAREVTNTFKAVSSAAVKAEENIRNVQEAYSKWIGGKPSITVSQDIKEDTTGSYNFGLGRDMSDEEAREIRANAAAKRAAKMAAAGEWFDSHANTKSYNEEMLKGTKDQLKELEDRIFGVGNEAKKAGNKATKALEQTNTAAKKTQKTTSKLGDAFVRIVRFKIVASVLQNVIQSAKEGITALGEFDAEFKDTLNTYSASSKAAGGSFALAIAPALEAAAPLVEYIADGIGSIGNGISMITALLSGEDEYRAVKPVEQIKKELAAAEEKAENVKHLISGFDELNLFSKSGGDDQEIDIFEIKAFKDEAGGLSDALKEDLAKLGEFISVAGAAALVVGFLRDAFSSKNKTLKEQTKRTKEDADATNKLKETVNALVPSVNSVINSLGILGGLSLPMLDPTGITVPAAEASGALDILGAKQPAPVLATEPLLEGLGIARSEIDAFVNADYAPVVLTASDAELVKGMEAAGVKVDEFAGSFAPSFGAAFSDVVDKWDASMVQLKAIAVDAFAQIEYQFKTSVGNMSAAWDKQFGDGLTVNTPQVEENPTATANDSGWKDKTIGDVVNDVFKIDETKDFIGHVAAGALGGEIVKKITNSGVGKKVAEEVVENVYNYAKDKVIVGGAGKALGSAARGIGAGVGAGIGGGGAFSVGGVTGGVMFPNLRSAGLFANGGLVTSGEVFVARENGMPEFVGSFGGQTGVANNEQIVSGIAGGVESALAAYIPQIIRAIEENAASVSIGDDQIARAASRGNQRYIRMTGQSMF